MGGAPRPRVSVGHTVKLRPYQANAAEAILGHWKRGTRSVCLVAPTGAGKTVCAAAVMQREACLAVAHRRDLVEQLADVFVGHFGEAAVGVLMAGRKPNPEARIQVGTAQTLLARGSRPDVERMFWDECQHAVCDEWLELARAFPNAKFLGATATPERADGTPLGDVCDAMVVAAHYSELIAAGHLVPARVFRPHKDVGSNRALSPLVAWQRYGNGSQAFAFCSRVETAEADAKEFRDAGVAARCISAETPSADRRAWLGAFRRGDLRVITNVATMTEGIDVPEARCAILAHDYGFLAAYLQSCGRVLRASAGKLDAIILDLVGSSERHLSPSMDRTYSLEGRPIRPRIPRGTPEARESFRQDTLDVSLVESTVTLSAPAPAFDLEQRRRVYDTLRAESIALGRSSSDAAVRYRDRFGEYPPLSWRERA
jgi:DNA repair protein RadD